MLKQTEIFARVNVSRRPKYGEKKNHENQFFNTLQYTSLLKYANQCIKCHKFHFHLFFLRVFQPMAS